MTPHHWSGFLLRELLDTISPCNLGVGGLLTSTFELGNVAPSVCIFLATNVLGRSQSGDSIVETNARRASSSKFKGCVEQMPMESFARDEEHLAILVQTMHDTVTKVASHGLDC